MIKITYNDHEGWIAEEFIIGSLETAIRHARNVQQYIECSAHIQVV